MSAEPLLIYRLGSIGDTVVALPSLRAIARTFPRHHRVLLTNSPTSARASSPESVLAGTGLIHEAIYYPEDGDTLRKFSALLLELRRRQVRTMVYLQPRLTAAAVLRDVLFFRAAGVTRIIGVPRSVALRQCLENPRTGELEFEAARLARTLQPEIAVDLSPAEFDLQLSESEQLVAANYVLCSNDVGTAPIAIAAGAKWAAKDWGEANWAALLESLRSEAGSGPKSVVFVGAADESDLAARLACKWSRRSLNLCGAITPRETAAVLARCALLICHDSGPMHLAASQQTPCVALFGNLNRPRRWFPYGESHQVIYEPSGVKNISVARVTEAVIAVLGARARVAA
jgi:heptosyltransferase III